MGFASLWTLPAMVVSIAAMRWLPGAARTWALVVASVAFYSALDVAALLLVAAVVVVSWVGGTLLERRRSRLILTLAILGTLMPLALSKYAPWLVEVYRTGEWWRTSDLGARGVAPGLAFLSLQAIGLLVDIWRGLITAERYVRNHVLFLMFFPQLIAGPIERAASLRPQLLSPARPDADAFYRAGKLLLWGYTLKLCVADALASPIERWLRLPESEAPAGLVLALLLFSARLYLDFYAYSCIAVALGAAHGIRLTQNFQNPFGAGSLTDFWRRWHISLSTWLRDYVYQPLGGRREGVVRGVIAVLVVFLLSGLWHGAGFGFLIWGAFHGIGLVSERAASWLSFRTIGPVTYLRSRVLHCFGVLATGLFVSLAWLPFLAGPNFSLLLLASRLLNAIAGGLSTFDTAVRLVATDWWMVCLGVTMTAFAHRMEPWYWRRSPSNVRSVAADVVLTNALALSLLLFGSFGGRSFIYFAF